MRTLIHLRTAGLYGSVLAVNGNSLQLSTMVFSASKVARVAGLALVVAFAAPPQSDHPPVLEPLKPGPILALVNQRLGPIRLSEGRLSGFSYAERNSRIALSARSLRDAIVQVDREAPSVEKLRARGILWLAAGNAKVATNQIEKATSYPTAGADVYSDLSSIRLELARRSGDPQDLIKALSAAHRAISLAPELPEARFNLALILESLTLRNTAGEAWARYLALDSSSDWAREAQAHFNALHHRESVAIGGDEHSALQRAAARADVASVRKITRRSPQISRLYAEEVLLAVWARTASRNSAKAYLSLQLAGQIGTAVYELSGDPMLRDTVSILERHEAEGGPFWDILIRGHLFFAQGLDAYHAQHFAQALALFNSADDLLLRGRSPFHLWASLYAGICEYQGFAYETALHRLAGLRREAARRGYLVLLGRVLWIEGLTQVVRGQLAESFRAYMQSTKAFRAAGELGNLAAVDRLIAQDFRYLGLRTQAWKWRIDALIGLSRFPDPQRRQSVLQEATTACLEQGDPEAALYFQKEALQVAQEMNRPLFLASALRRQAEILASLHQPKESLAALDQSAKQAAKIEEVSVRHSTQADLDATRGEVLLETDPRAAVAWLDNTLSFYETTEYRIHSARLHLLRGLAYEASGDQSAAQDDFMTAVGQIEKGALNVNQEEFRTAFIGQAQAIFANAARFFAKRNDAEQALAYAEAGRARNVLAKIASLQANEGDSIFGQVERVPELQASIPADTAVLEYLELDDRLLIWAITTTSLCLQSVPMRTGALAAEVRHFNGLIQNRDEGPSFRASAKRLYGVLIAPVIKNITVKRLILVPDGSLQNLPFVALLDPDSGAFLIEEFALGVAPSLWTFIRALDLDRSGSPAKSGRTLVVAASRFSASGLAGLQDLPAARTEALSVANLYSKSELLLDQQSSRAAVLAAIPGARIVHFATHAVISPERPSYSVLLLGNTSSDGGNESLSGEDLARIDWRSAKVVFLSACRTGDGLQTANEGPMSLASLLMEAGAQSVVASRWQVNDEGGEEIARGFHARLRSGDDVLSALQHTQISLLRRPGPLHRKPAVWASFYALGSGL